MREYKVNSRIFVSILFLKKIDYRVFPQLSLLLKFICGSFPFLCLIQFPMLHSSLPFVFSTFRHLIFLILFCFYAYYQSQYRFCYEAIVELLDELVSNYHHQEWGGYVLYFYFCKYSSYCTVLLLKVFVSNQSFCPFFFTHQFCSIFVDSIFLLIHIFIFSFSFFGLALPAANFDWFS